MENITMFTLTQNHPVEVFLDTEGNKLTPLEFIREMLPPDDWSGSCASVLFLFREMPSGLVVPVAVAGGQMGDGGEDLCREAAWKWVASKEYWGMGAGQKTDRGPRFGTMTIDKELQIGIEEVGKWA